MNYKLFLTGRSSSLRGLTCLFNRLKDISDSFEAAGQDDLLVKRYISHIYQFALPALREYLLQDYLGSKPLFKFCDNHLLASNEEFDEKLFYTALKDQVLIGNFSYKVSECAFVAIQCLLVGKLGQVCFIDGEANYLASRKSKLLASLLATTKINLDLLGDKIFPYEELLLMDPTGDYGKMSSGSKRSYRIASGRYRSSLGMTEEEYLETAINISKRAALKKPNDVESHIGYYLVDDGICEIKEVAIALSQTKKHKIKRVNKRSITVSFYLFMLLFFSIFLIFPLLYLDESFFLLHPMFLFFLLFMSVESVSSWVEKLLGRLAGERVIAKFDYEKIGIPDESRCGLIIPTMLFSKLQIDKVFQVLEANYRLANDSNVYAVILTDYVDSIQENPSALDIELLEHCKDNLLALNNRYANGDRRPFALLHRKRVFSKTQGMFIGYERKRGKISAFNRFVMNLENPFDLVIADFEFIRSLKYALILDDDCLVSKDSVQNLVGAMSHPLNKPVFSACCNFVERGYGMMVPCTLTSSGTATNWRFPALIAPRTERQGERVVPTRNFLFDVFGRCQYPGKGIYDIEAYEKALTNKMPEDLILSHDTIESCWIRPAYFGDATISEGVPIDFPGLIVRQHRWIRGNLQNMFFAISFREYSFPKVFWIVLINQLRIDITALSVTAFIAGLLFIREGVDNSAAFIAAAFVLSAPMVALSVYLIFIEISKGKFRSTFFLSSILFGHLLVDVFYKIFISLTHSLIYVDAFVRVSYRVISGKRLLDWRPASSCNDGAANSTLPYYRWIASSIGCLLLIYCKINDTISFLNILICSLWIATPLLLKLMKRSREKR